jgi:hypothetical protein
MDLQVAATIFEQIGGHRFMLMTGSSNFVGDGDSLTMRLTHNLLRARWLKITLMPDDTYMMEFIVMRGEEPVVVRKYRDVYWDQLQELFTEATGLQTTL